MRSVKLSKKIALVVDGIEKTNYIFDSSYETSNLIVLWNLTTLKIYNKDDGDIMFEILNTKITNVLTYEYGVLIKTSNEHIFYNFNNPCGTAVGRKIKVKDEGIIVKDGNKIDVYSRFGNIVISNYYDKVYLKNKGVIVEKDNKFGVYSYDGNIIVPVIYDNVNCYTNNIITTLDNKYGCYLYNGMHIINDECDKVEFINDIFVARKNNKASVYKLEGEKIFDFEPDDVSYYYNSFVLTKNGLQGLFDTNGAEILPIKYDKISMQKSRGEIYQLREGKDDKIKFYIRSLNSIIEAERVEIENNTYFVKKDGIWKAIK